MTNQPPITFAFSPIPRYSPAPMSFIKSAKFLLPISALLVLGSVIAFFKPGPLLSIEFTGGTLMELRLPEDISKEELTEAVTTYKIEGVDLLNPSVSKTQAGTYFLRIPTIDNNQHTALSSYLESTLGEVEELQYTTIGPTVGESLRSRAFWALLSASIAIIVYLAFAFRKIPRSMSPWSFGLSAVVALLHDIIITTGIFTIISRSTAFQMDTLFVTALLSIMGYSVNDTIIIFDRFRENLLESGKKQDIATLADLSLKQTLTRTFNTTMSTLVVLASLLLIGSESIRWFVLTLMVGTIIGTYSSFFVATPLLVYWKRKSAKN